MRTLKLTIAYDGTAYVGWQRQTNGVSVQQIVEDAFVPLVGAGQSAPGVAGAGRTDAGAHARGQVASVNVEFDLPPAAVQRALNVRLPFDVRVVAVEEAPLGFHARFCARGKAYRYRIATTAVLSPFDRWYVWHAPQCRDLAAMRRAASMLVGRHDFASFQARGSTTVHTVRTIDRVELVESEGGLVIDIAGNGFLRHMVRTIAGTLAEVGGGLRAPESLSAVLSARDRSAAGPTAPACGLTLMGVRY
jgi:tRNA pseudouridine38-40 synthase